MPVTKGTYANNESIVYSYLKSQGLNTALVCGILANISRESGFNPNAYNAGENAVGICQWRGGRLTNLQTYCKSLNLSYRSLKGQVMFILYELDHGEKNAKKKLSNIGNTSSGAYLAGYNFCEYYERATDSENIPRAQLASTTYWPYYSTNPAGDIPMAENVDFSVGRGTTDVYENKTTVTTEEHDETIIANLTKVEKEQGYMKGYGYLYDLTHGDVFRFYIPEFSTSAGVNYGTVDIPGRSVDVLYYQSTHSKKITINLDLYAGVGLYDTDNPVDDLHKDIKFIESLEYPDYNNTFAKPPSKVQLILGPNINFQGVVSDVNVSHLKPSDTQGRSLYVKLSFTVTQVEKNPPDWKDVRDGIYSINSKSPSLKSAIDKYGAI